MKKEIWKAIPGYEGMYEVSDLGRVKSLSREIKYNNRTAISKEKLLNGTINNYGYIQVSLMNSDDSKTKRIHKLVAMAFLNHIPDGYNLVVDHIDNNKLNNRLDNLQVISQRENASKDKKGGTSKYIGVHWSKSSSKWRAGIRINNKIINLGNFNSEQEASKYYQKALISIENGTEIIKKEAVFSSKYKGVCWHKQKEKWASQIIINKRKIYLGSFTDELEASKAYQEALTRINNGLSAKADK